MAMNFVTFNQDYSYIAVGTSKGFRIFTTDPFAKSYETKEGNIAMLEMLFSTSLVALILSPRRLQIMNTKRQSTICEMTFSTTVLAVRLNRKRLVIVLEDQIYLYDIQTMKLLYTIETSPNPTAICTLSPSSENCYLAYPLPQKAPPSALTPPSHTPPRSTHVTPTSGEVLIFDTVKLEAINVIEAHRSPLCCIALNSEGTLLATASDKGTIIRVFSVPDGRKLYQFRRGSMPSKIYHMSFNVTSTLLCVSSATDTIHIFKLSPPQKSTSSEDSRPVGSSDGPELYPPLGEEFGSVSGMRSNSNATTITTSTSQSSTTVATATSISTTLPTGEIASRKPNGTLMGMIRRTSQNVGSSLANTVGGYLPKGVTEMWEPARDFAWIRLPKSAASASTLAGGGNGGVGSGNLAGTGLPGSHKPVRSMVAMCPNTPQVMVVTSDGYLYVYDVDLSKGGEGKLTKQYCYID